MKHIFSNIPEDREQRPPAMDGTAYRSRKARRSEEFLELNEQRESEYVEAMAGKELEILLEEEEELDGRQYLIGHSREYVKTAVEKRERLKGKRPYHCERHKSPGKPYTSGKIDFSLYFAGRYIKIIMIIQQPGQSVRQKIQKQPVTVQFLDSYYIDYHIEKI